MEIGQHKIEPSCQSDLDENGSGKNKCEFKVSKEVNDEVKYETVDYTQQQHPGSTVIPISTSNTPIVSSPDESSEGGGVVEAGRLGVKRPLSTARIPY